MGSWAGLEGQPTGTKAAIQAQLQKIKDSGRDSVTILLLGKSGVGKSATVNTIIGERVRPTNPFQAETLQAAEVKRQFQGLEVSVIDTPGLVDTGEVSQSALKNILQFLVGRRVDVLIYVDRLDSYAADLTDHLVIKAITRALGKEVWSSGLVVLTRGQLAPSDGRTYEEFVARRAGALEDIIRKQAGLKGDIPIFKVENSAGRSRTNSDGDRILPDGSVWVPLLFQGIADAALSGARKVEVSERTVQGPDPNRKFKVLIPLILLAQVFLVFLPLKQAIEQDKVDEFKNRPRWEVEAEEHRRRSAEQE